MKRSLLLITSILLLTTTVRAQDTAKVKPAVYAQPDQYRIFMFTKEVAVSIFNMIGVCPDDIKGSISLNEARAAVQQQFTHPAITLTDTMGAPAKPVEAKKKKK